ncbi:hypothetical protein C0995_009130 [Termitomyces sp. Mi166|nr:hypothetical protein C0995_009130 [Termitomyces sp. Mi166\
MDFTFSLLGHPNVTAVKQRFVGEEWGRKDRATMQKWLDDKIKQVTTENKPFIAPVQKFQQLIEGSTEILKTFDGVFEALPVTSVFNKGLKKLQGYETMLRLLNSVVTEAPDFATRDISFTSKVEIIVQWAFGFKSCRSVFRITKFRDEFENVLKEYTKFLSSSESAYVLRADNPDGWLSSAALQELELMGFKDLYVCDPTKPHYGYTSYDDFFTRRLKDALADSAAYYIAKDVPLAHEFWLKHQSYSLSSMLGQSEYSPKFSGGTVYQAFLSPINYHRWHAPVSGSVVKTQTIPGRYFSYEGELDIEATRTILYIQADEPGIGLVALVCVGMVEVGTCEVTIEEGSHVDRGQELGSFHFGGSTCCLIFQSQVKIEFASDLGGKVNKKIGTIASA